MSREFYHCAATTDKKLLMPRNKKFIRIAKITMNMNRWFLILFFAKKL
jgi:hypothetical protein